MMWLKQAAAVTLKIGPFVDEDDGKTAETGLTIAQADVRLSKNGGDMAQKNESTSCSHDELGIYGCPLDTTDTGTLGRLQLFVHESGALPVWHEFMVIPTNEYDSLVSGSDALRVHAVEMTENLITSVVIASNAIGADAIAANSIGAAELDPSGVAEIADAVWDELATGHADAGKAGQQLWADLDAVLADTAELQTDDVPGLIAALNDLIAALNDLSAAEVNAEADTALSDYDPPTKAELDSGLAGLNDLTAAQVNAEVDTALADVDLDHLIQVSAGAEQPADGAYLDLMMHKGAGQGFDPTTDSLEAIRDNMAGVDVAAIVNAVWDEVLGGHLSVDTTGLALSTILGAAPSGGVLGRGGTATLGDLVKEVALRLGTYRRLTATSGSTTTVVDTVGLIEADDAFVNMYVYVLEDAGGGASAPEGEERLITGYTRSSATLTVAPAFSVAVAVDDVVEIMPERRDRIVTGINAAISAAGERWSNVSRETSTLTVVASTYEYDLGPSFSTLSRLLSVWVRGESSEAWREIPPSNYHLTGTPSAEVLVFDTLDGLDAGDEIMLQYRQLPSTLTEDTHTLGVGAVAERELVRFIVEYALGWLHQAAASSSPQNFREHWSLSKRHYDAAEEIRKAGGGRRRSGRVRYRKPPNARG